VRYLTAALQTVDAGLAKITPSMDHAARSLGHTPAQTLRRVHLPLLRGSLLTAALLVFVDVMKELPATLVMRPSTSTPWPPRPTPWPPTSAWPRRHRRAGHRGGGPAADDRARPADLRRAQRGQFLLRVPE
jgi:hypothetical protein